MHARTHARGSLVGPRIGSNLQTRPRAPRGRKEIRITKICPIFLRRCYFLAHACFSTVINNRIIHRARSNASLATLSGIISSGLIVHYYFDVRQESITKRRKRREREREEARSHFTEHEPRLYSWNNANVIVNYEHLKRNGVRGEERRDEWYGNRKKS